MMAKSMDGDNRGYTRKQAVDAVAAEIVNDASRSGVSVAEVAKQQN